MNKTVCKLLFIIPLVLFLDWILMIIIGCLAGMCQAGAKFFCSTYCTFGILLVGISLAIAMYYVFQHKPKLPGCK